MTAGAAAAVSAMTTTFQSETVEAKPLSLEATLKGNIFFDFQGNTKKHKNDTYAFPTLLL